MDGYDVLRAVVRWIHVVASVTWIGGSIFYLSALRPALGKASPESRRAVETAVNQHFRDAVDLSIIALIVTGVIITFDRVSQANLTALYFIVLGLKLTAFVSMLYLARQLGTRMGRLSRKARTQPPLSEPTISEATTPRAGWKALLSPSRLILVLGLVAFFLSMLLVHIYENTASSL